MTESQIESRLNMLDKLIARERDMSTLATLNRCYNKLIDQLVAIDLRKEKSPE